VHVKYAKYAGKMGRSSASKLLEACSEERGGGVRGGSVTNGGNVFLQSTALLERGREKERTGPEGPQLVERAGAQGASVEGGNPFFRVRNALLGNLAQASSTSTLNIAEDNLDDLSPGGKVGRSCALHVCCISGMCS